MKNNIPGITMLSLGDEIGSHLKAFAKNQKESISHNQLLVIRRWANNTEVLQELGFRYFDEWEEGGRRLTVKQFAEKVIQDVLSAYD